MSSIASDVIKPICLLIITICFLIEFLKTSMKVDMLKWEHVLKVLAKFVISKVVIDIAPTVLSAIYYTTSEWISDSLGIITASPSLSNTASGVLDTLFDSINNWQAIGLALTMLLLFLVIGLSGLIIKVMAYARMFELYVYIAISPLPSAFFPLDESGGSRITRSFFLSFAAVCLQGLMMIICMRVFDSIVGQAINLRMKLICNISGIIKRILHKEYMKAKQQYA